MLRRPVARTLVAIVAVLASAAQAQAATPKITAHAETPVVNQGEKLELALTAKNRARSKSAKTSVEFLLSDDTRESKDDLPLKGKAKIPALGPRKSKTVRFDAKLPKAADPDAYNVLVCAAKCKPMKGTVGVGPPVQRVHVSPQPAGEDQAATAAIGPQGGRVDALANDGTVYSLVVPEGALAFPTQIKITPLAQLNGSPLGGELIGGAQLEPDGLELAKPATLAIQGDRINPGPGRIAFGYHGGGEDFHLEPFYRQPPQSFEGYDPSKTILIPVSHFSGTGVQPATDIDTVRDLRYGAMEARDRLAEQAAKAIQKERDTGESATPELERIVGDYLDQVVIPDAAAASFSDALYANGLQSYLSWERQRQLLGIEGDFAARIAQVERLLDQAFKALVKRLSDRCKAGDLAIQGRILALERQLQLLGVDDHSEEFARLIEDCYRFELRVTSQLEHHADDDLGGGWYAKEDYSIGLEGAAPLTVAGELGLGELTGNGPFDYRQANIAGSGRVDFGPIGYEECTFYGTGATQSGGLTVLGGNLPYRAGEAGGTAIPATILLDPGQPQEEVHFDCQGAAFGQSTSSSENQWEQHWLRYFKSTHAEGSEDPNGDGPWLLSDFQPGRHPILAEQVATFTSEQYAYSLTETFQLVHTPLEN
jgi:hypothetical protein